MENEVVQLYLDDIIPNRFQPREVFNDQALKELAISIREHGVIQPIIVRKFGDKYEIIAGERRYKASTMAGLTKIPAIVRNLDDKESSKVALIENLQRRDLTPIEEARTYQKILDLDEMTQEDLAKTMGKSQSSVSNKLRLLSLPDEVQEALLKEEISERHARSLLNLNDKNMQVELLKEVISTKMTVRDLDAKIKKLTEGASSESSETSGGSMMNVVEQPDQEKANDLITPPEPMSANQPLENSNNIESLFTSANSRTTDNLFSDNVQPTNETNTNDNLGAENKMNNDSLFGNSSNQNDINTVPDILNNTNIFGPRDVTNDPTTVDINKIREQSADIAPKPTEPSKSIFDVNGLVNKNVDVNSSTNNASSFIPKFNDEQEAKPETTNINGNGLLSGMPSLKPVENTPTPNSSNTSSLFGSSIEQNTSSVNNNSLFTTPTVDTIKTNNESLFGSNPNNSSMIADSMVSSNSVTKAVQDVKDVIKACQDKGYKVSVEELNLDNEIQLIVKFNKD